MTDTIAIATEACADPLCALVRRYAARVKRSARVPSDTVDEQR